MDIHSARLLLCRLTNIGNTSLVLDDITLSYWFNGPADSSVSVDQFRPVCSDTTIGKLRTLPNRLAWSSVQ